ncbi:MAG: hypothetical protein HQL62_09415 [Magnetococcales bacterium]|nr:hypothetical protein [Magnetococcales bacterium]
MDWQHGAADGSHDYLIAQQDGQLLGILGYIATRRFDPQLAAHNTLWLALWKIVDGCGVAGLGLRMLGALREVEPHVALAVNGINKTHPPMYRALGYRVGEWQRFFLVNPQRPRRLIQAPPGWNPPLPRDAGGTFIAMTEASLRDLDPARVAFRATPGKTPVYFLHRFLRHPFYRYRVFLAEGPAHGAALYAVRVAEHAGALALRVVDFAGDAAAIAYSGAPLAGLMEKTQAEFCDFAHLGLPEAPFLAAGFARLDPDGPVIVPHYFEPFLASNSRVWCAIRTDAAAPTVICRADGDQDRPNLLPFR